MPPRGVKKGSKEGRMYEHIKDSYEGRGASDERAEEIAARTVNQYRSEHGETEESHGREHDRDRDGKKS